MPPKQSMLGCLGRAGHSLTYGFEDFSFAQIWNQQAEKRATFANRSLAYIGARPGNPIHQPPFFQLTDRSEERRVGKECKSGVSRYHDTENTADEIDHDDFLRRH